MVTLREAFERFKEARVVDLTHQINENSPHFPALPALEKKDIFTLKDGFHVQQFSVVGQYGTHIDAPIHLSLVASGWMSCHLKISFCHFTSLICLKKLPKILITNWV